MAEEDTIIFEGSLVALLRAVYLSDQVTGSDEDSLLDQFVDRSMGNAQIVRVTASQLQAAVKGLAERDDMWAQEFDVGMGDDGFPFECHECGGGKTYSGETFEADGEKFCSQKCRDDYQAMFADDEE